MMIYCKLKNIKGNTAVYYFGNKLDDITGEAEFYSSFTQPTILKQPTTGSVPEFLLSKIIIKYKEKLLNSNFPDKMSFER